MMVVGGVNKAGGQTGQLGMAAATDSVSRNIKEQIAKVQKQLQELSLNKEMSMEEKMKKRQELQKQIADLNNQLRQHQNELRREMQQEKQAAMKESLSGANNTEAKKTANQETGFSQTSMHAIISGDTAMSQAKVHGSVAAKMEGRAGVLKAEIKQDAFLGGNTQAKQEQLAEVEKTARQASASQMSTLGEANKEIKESVKADQLEEKVEREKEKEEEKAKEYGN